MKLIQFCLCLLLVPAYALAQGWSVLATPPQLLFSVSFIDANNGWAVGTGQILHTSNGGIDWIAQAGVADPVLHSIFFSDPNNGWTVGEGSKILHTGDGGATWVRQRGTHPASYLSVHFIDANIGWIVGTIGTIMHTTDGGQTWNNQAGGVGTYYFLNSVRFVDVNTGWAVGVGGKILHSTDGGTTWNEQSSGTDNRLTSVCFVDANVGWVVGYDGTIIKTTDGGTSWIHQSSGTEVSLESVQFTDANTGWSVGDGGTILHTTDAGNLWSIQASGTGSNLLAVSFTNNNLGWAVGRSNGVVIHTTTGGTGIEPPDSITLSFPLNGSFVSTPLALSWNPASNALWYTLQISASPFFVTTVLNQTNITGTSFQVDSLQPGVTYHWRVSLTGLSGTSNWSEVWSFTLGSAGGDPIAQFGVCYGSTGSADTTNPGALITIDPLTGAGMLVGPTGIIGTNGPSVPVLAIKFTGELYALSASNSSDLYAINASTGAGTLVANTGLVSPDALAFDANDVMYAIANNNNLYTVNVTTGVATLVGPTGFATKALSYDPTDGAMYGSSTTDQIYIIDLTTGASTLVGVTGLGGPTHALRFDQGGNLFGTKGNASNPYTLISIDKATGHGATIGTIGFEGVLGLASRLLYTPPAIPVTVDVLIDSLHQFVPAEGDTFAYTLTFKNNTSSIQTIDWWTKVLKPRGNPIDPLSGPTALTLSPFATMVIDTPLLAVPSNSWTGNYSLVGYVGTYAADTVDADTAGFYKLPAIPCEDISQFQARCRPGGIMQARIILTDASHTGDLAEFTIDDVPYEATVGRNGRALLSLAGFNQGSHDVEITEPPDCYPPIVVTCPVGIAKEGDSDFWDEDESWEVPTTTALLGNYPNPFNPSTTFRYALSEDAHVTLKVYNLLGQLVATLVDESQTTGYKSVVWNGRNDVGSGVASGIYIYRMTAGRFTDTKRMLLLK